MEKFSFIYAGQGAQFIQMGKSFYDNYLIAKQTYDEASYVLKFDVAKLCFEGSFREINNFTNMQYAITTTQIAIYRSYMGDYGIAPQFAAGHSIGEYSALVSAGSIDFSDCLLILKKRGELIKGILSENKGRMTIVEKTSLQNIETSFNRMGAESQVSISCYNSKSQYALSGNNSSLDAAEQLLVDTGAAISPLIYSPPMHSCFMEKIEREYYDYLKEFTYYPFRYPVICNVTGRPLTNHNLLPELLSKHLISPVLWTESSKIFAKYGVTVVIEMGPKNLISGFIKEDHPNIRTYCYGVNKDRQELDEIFNNEDAYEKDMPDFLGRCLSILAATENKNSNIEEFSVVVKTYKELKRQYLESLGNKMGNKKMLYKDALLSTIEALRVKKLSKAEIKWRIKMLLDETNNIYLFHDIYKEL